MQEKESRGKVSRKGNREESKEEITEEIREDKMNELLAAMLQEKKKLDQVIIRAEKGLRGAPRGKLRISRKGASTQFYLRTDPKEHNGKYLKKPDRKLVQALAQKSYLEKVLAVAKKESRNLQKAIRGFHPDRISRIYQDCLPERRELLLPLVLPPEEYARRWESAGKMENDSRLSRRGEESFLEPEGENGIVTEKGERVRSKSEKILADKLAMMHIPYLYEKPLYLAGYGTVRPDFTVLNVRTGKEFYWEHLGMMDHPDYCEKAVLKIETYERNLMWPGRQLIMTYETEGHPLNMKIVEKIIREFFL